jgi:hypothetical protein
MIPWICQIEFAPNEVEHGLSDLGPTMVRGCVLLRTIRNRIYLRREVREKTRAMARGCKTQGSDSRLEDRHRKKKERGERMTKNKIREAPLPRADQGTNDARAGLPIPTVRKSVTCVQPEPTTSDVTLPQQLSADTKWAEPSIVKRQLAKGSPGVPTTRDRTQE